MSGDVKCDEVIEYSDIAKAVLEKYRSTYNTEKVGESQANDYLISETKKSIKNATKKSAVVVGILKDKNEEKIILWGHKIYFTKENRISFIGEDATTIPVVGIRLIQKEVKTVLDALEEERGIKDNAEGVYNCGYKKAYEEFWWWHYVTKAQGVERLYEALSYAWMACRARLGDYNDRISGEAENIKNTSLNHITEDPRHSFIGMIAIEKVLEFLCEKYPKLKGHYDHTSFDEYGNSEYIENHITKILDADREHLRKRDWDRFLFSMQGMREERPFVKKVKNNLIRKKSKKTDCNECPF